MLLLQDPAQVKKRLDHNLHCAALWPFMPTRFSFYSNCSCRRMMLGICMWWNTVWGKSFQALQLVRSAEPFRRNSKEPPTQISIYASRIGVCFKEFRVSSLPWFGVDRYSNSYPPLLLTGRTSLDVFLCSRICCSWWLAYSGFLVRGPAGTSIPRMSVTM